MEPMSSTSTRVPDGPRAPFGLLEDPFRDRADRNMFADIRRLTSLKASFFTVLSIDTGA